MNPTQQFHRDGYVILEDVLDRAWVEAVRDEFMRCMNAKVARLGLEPVSPHDWRDHAHLRVKRDFQPEGGNHDLNRWNMHLPTQPEFINESLLAHPRVLPVIKSLLGPEPVAFLIASDTPYPGAGFQNIHQDFPRFGLTVNIPLVDFTEDNAPLEIWPRSHLHAGDAFHDGAVTLSARQLERLVSTQPGQRMRLKAGSVLIRDQRLVHRGTAHTGRLPRPCLSIWYKRVDRLSLPGLTIPMPHRAVADRLAARALTLRESARGGGRVHNRALLNLGNFFGRVIEETSGSDRDARRRISASLWSTLSPEVKSLLRFASVENQPETKRSRLGSWVLRAAAAVFSVAARFRSRSPVKPGHREQDLALPSPK